MARGAAPCPGETLQSVPGNALAKQSFDFLYLMRDRLWGPPFVAQGAALCPGEAPQEGPRQSNNLLPLGAAAGASPFVARGAAPCPGEVLPGPPSKARIPARSLYTFFLLDLCEVELGLGRDDHFMFN